MRKKCEHCGREFETKPTTPGQRYCSTHCYDEEQKYQRRLRRLIRSRSSPERKCEHCGREFAPRKNQRYCSEECVRAAANARRAHPILIEETCANCGVKFKTASEADKFCSNRCSLEYIGFSPREHSKIQSGELLRLAREAAECNLDYGTYRAQLAQGKSYEELKALATTRIPRVHQHTPQKGTGKLA